MSGVASRTARRALDASDLLAAAGIEAAVTSAGLDGDIAAVRAPALRLADVAAPAAAIRALGFRYVALEIGPDAAGIQPPD